MPIYTQLCHVCVSIIWLKNRHKPHKIKENEGCTTNDKNTVHLPWQYLQFYSQTVIDTVFAGVGFLDLAHI